MAVAAHDLEEPVTSVLETANPPDLNRDECLIGDCSRSAAEGVCDACAILFGPYERLLAQDDVKEWSPDAPRAAGVADAAGGGGPDESVEDDGVTPDPLGPAAGDEGRQVDADQEQGLEQLPAEEPGGADATDGRLTDGDTT